MSDKFDEGKLEAHLESDIESIVLNWQGVLRIILVKLLDIHLRSMLIISSHAHFSWLTLDRIPFFRSSMMNSMSTPSVSSKHVLLMSSHLNIVSQFLSLPEELSHNLELNH